MLSDGQKRQFVRDGYLVVEDGIDEERVTRARTAIEETLPEDTDDPEALVGVGSRAPDVPAAEPFRSIKRRLYEYGTALAGDGLVEPTGPNMQLALRYPADLRLDEHHDRRPLHGHLDGFGPGYKETGEYSSWMVGAVVYFGDVVERGGGFTVWPGSHWVAANYFEDHALNTPGYGGTLPAMDDDGSWDCDRVLEDQLRSVELNHDAGTVILWHNKLYHSSGVNQSRNIRLAGITRFSREDQEEITEDAAENPFKYWGGIADTHRRVGSE